MADTKKEKKVKIFIPRATSNKDDPNLFVGINGMNYLLPKGKTSLVPPEVALELRRAEHAREARDAAMDSLQRVAP